MRRSLIPLTPFRKGGEVNEEVNGRVIARILKILLEADGFFAPPGLEREQAIERDIKIILVAEAFAPPGLE